MVALILVDSNVWIFLNVDNYPEHPLADEKIADLRNRGLATNVIVVSEVFHKLSALLGRAGAKLRTNKILNSVDISYIPMDEAVVEAAIDSAATKAVRINDALIAHQAIALKIPILTDNVKDFKKIRNVEIIPLR